MDASARGEVAQLESELSLRRYVPLVESEFSYLCFQPTSRAVELSKGMDGAEDPYVKALAATANGEFGLAEKLLIAAEPSISQAKRYRLLAQISYYKGDLSESRQYYELAIQAEHGDLETLIDYGWILGLTGDYDLSVDIMGAIDSLLDTSLGSAHEAARRARIRHVYNLAIGGRSEEAIGLVGDLCADLWSDRNIFDSTLVAHCLGSEGFAYLEVGEFEEAIDRFERGLDVIAGEVGCQATERVILLRHYLGKAFHASEDFEAARREYLWVLRRIEEEAGRDSFFLLAVLGDLGDLSHEIGRYEEAEDFYGRAVGLASEWKSNPSALALVNVNLARLRENRENFTSAEELYRETLKLVTRYPESFSLSEIFIIRNNYAGMLLQAGEAQRALQMQEETVEGFEERNPGPHRLKAIANQVLAASYGRVGRLDEAEVAGRRSVEIALEVSGDAGLLTSDCLNVLGGILADKGKYAEAVDVLDRAIRIREAIVGPGHLKVMVVNVKLARAYAGLGDQIASARHYEAASRSLLSQHHKPEMRRYLGVVNEFLDYLESIGDKESFEFWSAELDKVS